MSSSKNASGMSRMWSTNTMPLVWSISCCMTRAKNPSALNRTCLPSISRAFTRILEWRGTLPYTFFALKRPSKSSNISPSYFLLFQG